MEAARSPSLLTRQAGSLSVYHMAKSRWELENQGFHDAKNRYGMEHICHHQANSVLVSRLITLLAWSSSASTASALRTASWHPVRSAEHLCRLLRLSLSRPSAPDSS